MHSSRVTNKEFTRNSKNTYVDVQRYVKISWYEKKIAIYFLSSEQGTHCSNQEKNCKYLRSLKLKLFKMMVVVFLSHVDAAALCINAQILLESPIQTSLPSKLSTSERVWLSECWQFLWGLSFHNNIRHKNSTRYCQDFFVIFVV